MTHLVEDWEGYVFDYVEDCTATRISENEWTDPDCVDAANDTVGDLFTPNQSSLILSETESLQTWSTNESYSGYSREVLGTDHIVVDNEFTTENLVDAMIQGMPAYSGSWIPGSGAASLDLADSEACGSAWKAKYRFKIPHSERDVTYRISWYEVTEYTDDQSRTVDYMEEQVQGNGGLVYGGEHEMLPPYRPGSKTVDGVTIEIADGDGGTPGSGGPGGPGIGGGHGGGCCGGIAGGFGGGGSGVSFKWGVGRGTFGVPGGTVGLGGGLPGSHLFSPKSLQYPLTKEGVEILRIDNILAQIRTREAVVQAVTINPYKFELRFYHIVHISGTGANGLYTFSQGPFVTWTVENPNLSMEDVDTLKITETRGVDETEYFYEFNPATDTWTLTYPEVGSDNHWITITDGANMEYRHQTLIVSQTGGSDKLRLKQTFEKFSWGEAIVAEERGSALAPETTTYEYYASPPFTPNGSLVPLEEKIESTGYWERYVYDSLGRVTKVVAQFGNQSPGAAESVSRVTTYEYDSSVVSGSGDNGSIQPDTARRVIEKVNGQEIGRSYKAITSGPQQDDYVQVVDARCLTAGLTWSQLNANNSLTSITRYYEGGDDDGRPMSVENSDATMAFFSYAMNTAETFQTNMVASGKPNAGKTHIIDGTTNVTVIGDVGEIVRRTSHDIVSGIKVSEDTFTYQDGFKRSVTVTHLDGTSETFQYACCGLELHEDREGNLTSHLYDAAKRPLGSVRNNITTTNVLDAAGNVIKTVRRGTDNSLITLDQREYNLAGEMIAQTNALGGKTTFTEDTSGGYNRKTSTYPDGGTRIEWYFQDGSLYQITGTAVAPVRYEYGVESDGGAQRLYTKEIKLDSGFSPTSEWSKSYQDMAGRQYKTVYSGATNPGLSTYNAKGQLLSQQDPDTVTTLYQYNPKGELEATVADLDRDGVIDWTGTDRITTFTNKFETLSGTWSGIDARRQLIYVWPTDGVNTSLEVREVRTATDGKMAAQIRAGVATLTQIGYAPLSNYRYVTNTAPGGRKTRSIYRYGRLESVTEQNSGGGQITQQTYEYDPHGRVWKVTDARNGTTTYGYNDADQVVSVTTPPPGTSGPVQVTTTYFDTSSRAWRVLQPDGSSVTNEYFATGLLKKTHGTRTYPVEYTYDPQGRMKTMKTWKDFSGSTGAAITTWNYHASRGWLANKRYPDASTGNPGTTGPDYTYTDGGRLHYRDWARTSGGNRLRTTYTYGFNDGSGGNDHADLLTIGYTHDPETTPGVTYTYDRQGRRKTAARNGMTTTFYRNTADQLTSEAHSGGTLSTWSVTNTFDSSLRRTKLEIKKAGGLLILHNYTYDSASRLDTVLQGSYGAKYTYLANSPLIDKIDFRQNSTTIRLTTQRDYDKLNRLEMIRSTANVTGPVVDSHAYQYNTANQRVRVTQADGSYWVYQYDSLGQVISGRKYWADSSPVAGQQFEYGFDDIGNRTVAKSGGDETGAGLRTSTHTANALNQYTQRTVPDSTTILGVANTKVTVNTQEPGRKGEYFWKELSFPNTSARWDAVTVTGTGTGSESGNVFTAQTPEVFVHDADGNLTHDGRWVYSWDGENRLIRMVARTSVPAGAKLKLEYEYDHQGRRIRKKVFTWNGSAYNTTPATDLKFVYDGWNLIAEINASDAVRRQYMWGLDLSGSEQGAGGVGGLVKMYDNTKFKTYFPMYDGNGNVTGLVDGNTGTVEATYEYGPFGEPVRVTGSQGRDNPFRFSTKFTDDETDLMYYGYRYYNALMGRWLSRDPIEEIGGYNIYALTRNELIGSFDFLGLDCACGPDITDALKTTLAEVEQEFRSLSLWDQGLACAAVLGLGANPANAWDIDDLAKTSPNYKMLNPDYTDPLEKGESNHCCSSYSCVDTVVINGRCVHSSQGTFALLGRIAKLCNLPMGGVHAGINGWKRWRYPDADPIYNKEAHGITDYGANDAWPNDFDGLGECRIKDNNKTALLAFDWTWEPFRPRTP